MQILPTSARGLVLICTATLFSHGANAQAGSVGGTVGKREKSVSGGENTTERRRVRTAVSAAGNRNHSAGFTAATISGSWQYESSCSGSRGQGSLNIVATSATSFTGAYYGSGKILHGRIAGSRVSFGTHFIIDRNWTGTVSGSGGALRMQGSFSGPTPGSLGGEGNCRFNATRT
jgi:hypothetical protein